METGLSGVCQSVTLLVSCCQAWVTAAVKSKVEDASVMDLASAAALHNCLFFPPLHLELTNPEDGNVLLGRKCCASES